MTKFKGEEKMETKKNVTSDMYIRAMDRVASLEHELDLYKQKTPLVGVVWYGQGGFGIGLSQMINGRTRVALEGFGAKAVIDYSTWIRIRGTEEAQNGILIRDDSVIKGMAVPGVVAEPDKKKNPNVFLISEIEKILVGSISGVKKTMNQITNHFPAKLFLKVAKDLNKEKEDTIDKSKLAIIENKYNELFIKHKWSLLHHHDLTTACELQGIDFTHLTDDQMIHKLSKLELDNE